MLAHSFRNEKIFTGQNTINYLALILQSGMRFALDGGAVVLD
jgi:hypothetical protein